MAERIELPGNHWAVLRDPEEVTERQRRPITRAMRGVRPEIVEQQQAAAALLDQPDGTPGKEKQKALRDLQYAMTNEEADAYLDAGDLAIVALVESWSFADVGGPIPITLDGVLDLPGRTLDQLRAKVSTSVSRLFLDVGPDPNPPAPSGGSNGSGMHSAEAQQTTSLASSATSGSSRSD